MDETTNNVRFLSGIARKLASTQDSESGNLYRIQKVIAELIENRLTLWCSHAVGSIALRLS